MNDRQLEAALDRLDRALQRVEVAAEKRLAAQEQLAARAAQLPLLEARHDELKQTVAQGLKQLDEILGGMGQ